MPDLISHIKAIYKLYNKTDIYFLAGEYDVICTEKINIDRGDICIILDSLGHVH
jgi:hypothetical protein